ncbi:DMT family transporter [Pelagibius litoralis]|uniref:DMT family transporter n=1 Tax=Pelagibius litoralis TaxID=374515 RepID=A0A967KBE5_9PROT|nr:DMT family transporter [Pelagibius litoralis]NIA71037.1 DMT family transporter [Pelagibius litoralis]
MSTPSATAGKTWGLAGLSAAGLFVLLWSTGFIGAKLGLPHAEPLTFLALRFAIAAVLLCLLAVATRAPWPKGWRSFAHLAVAGLLLHGLYLGGVFAGIDAGVEAGVAALIVGIQPVLVAALAGALLGERVIPRQWLGLILALGGVTLVVWRKLGAGLGTAEGVGLCLLALLGITAATLYQKRFCAEMDLRSGSVVQYVAAAIGCGVFSLIFEEQVITWSGEFIFAMAWLVLVLSLGAVSLLYWLIKRGEAARVSSLFFLAPPVTALIAWPLFGETFGLLALTGMLMTVLGVALVNLEKR